MFFQKKEVAFLYCVFWSISQKHKEENKNHAFSWAVCFRKTDKISSKEKIKSATCQGKLFEEWVCLTWRIYISEWHNICILKLKRCLWTR